MPHLLGTKVVLREYRESDFEHVRAWVNDPEPSTNLSSIFHRPHTEKMTRAFFDQVMEGRPGEYYFIIAERETGAYIGQVDLLVQQSPSRKAMLGIVIPDRANRGRGYGREAMTLILRYGFETLGLHAVRLLVVARNESAIKLYESVGFVHEGTMRDAIYRDGEFLDEHVMSVLDTEWHLRDGQGDHSRAATLARFQEPDPGT